jgi:hypothetical protein
MAIVSDDISVELTVVVRHKVHGRFKSKYVSFFRLNHLTHAQYSLAAEQLIAGITVIGQEFLDLGHDMTFQGKPIEEVCE